MMTPQEVANCTFAKAVMGGYNMASVDDFLDKLTEDYSALYKENSTLKGKLKTLAEKLEEYRQVEDAMRSTLLAAQKMASSMVAEAEAKRDALIADSAGAAKKRLEEIQQEVAQEEERLAAKRRETDGLIAQEDRRLAAAQEGLRGFIQSVQEVCQGQLALLERLPELPAQPEPAPAPAPADAAQEEQDAMDSEVEKNIQDVLDSFARESAQPEEDDPFAGEEDDEDEEDETATRVLNLDDLQFGRNYNRN